MPYGMLQSHTHTGLTLLHAAQAFDALHSAAVAVWHLQRVLAKKRDPLSHTLFLEALESAGADSPLEHFWCAPELLPCQPFSHKTHLLPELDIGGPDQQGAYVSQHSELWTLHRNQACVLTCDNLGRRVSCSWEPICKQRDGGGCCAGS